MNPNAKQREHKRYPRDTEPRVKRCSDPDKSPMRERIARKRKEWS